MRVAVVGAGIFGATTAVELARAGHEVDLYEARHGILDGATGGCQARIHRGYHYPRSDSTAAAVRDAAPIFEARYPEAIHRGKQYYLIADDSRVSADDYLAFCDRLGLEYQIVDNPPHAYGVQLCVQVPESYADVRILSRIVRRDVVLAGVKLHLGQRKEPDDLIDYDLTVMATNGQHWPQPLRYEVCEVALAQIGRYADESFVVLDGDYISLDRTPRGHILYDVAYSVHHANVGSKPEIPAEYQHMIDLPGTVANPPSSLSHFPAMVDSAGRFLRALSPRGRGVCLYVGSIFKVRAVLPDVDGTDERPTLIRREGRVVYLLGGKIDTAVWAARQITESTLEGVPA